jgi:uncharacterized protein (TIGR03085 family)
MTDDNPARAERAGVCEVLATLGPDQPTLCTGWTTRDLAAHLVVRERRPLAALGIVLPPLAGYTERVRRAVAARPFPELVEALRRPPAWSPLRFPPLDHAVNSLELFIHHEDIRRAQPGWAPRPLPGPLGRALWSRVRAYTRLRLRRFPATVVVEAPGHGLVRAGRPGDQVRVVGDPGELVMFLTGRQRAARVELTGPSTSTSRLSSAPLGL